MNSLEIGKTIFKLLSENEELKTYVGSKIYPLVATTETTFPFIVYKRSNITPHYTKDYYSGIDYGNIDVVVASNKYNESVEIAALVRDSLENRKTTQTENEAQIKSITLDSANEDFNDDTFIQVLSFNVKTQTNNG